MSKIKSLSHVCLACQTPYDVTVFESLNLDRIPQQLPHLLDGSFERQPCPACATVQRPEHDMLLTWPSRRLWLVMMPRDARDQLSRLEPEVEQRFAREWQQLPAVAKPLLEGVIPQLVFGQSCLNERLRAVSSGIPLVELECVKLLLYRRSLARLFPLGPVELLLDRFRSGGLTLGIYELRTLRRRGELDVSADAFEEVRANRVGFERRFPQLFGRPYLSASRCLFGA